MRSYLLTLAALALIVGCDREADKPTAASKASTPPAQTQANTPTTPAPSASTGATASPAEKKDGSNPVQGQVDPKQREQHKDFQQKGDSAGPTSPDTRPKY
jgi:hypothetical protein